MTASRASALYAVDVGNSRVKIGEFVPSDALHLPEPLRTLDLDAHAWQDAEVESWLHESAECEQRAEWAIASVFRAASERLTAWLASRRPEDRVVQLGLADLPLRVLLPTPEGVGLDRLLGAVAANRLRDPARGAVVVDLGSAITVDLVSKQGEFLGGAILPGIGMSARALFEQTDLLPSVAMYQLHDPVPALGTSTTEAIRAGLYWGAVGAIRELVARLSAVRGAPVPHVFLTGGAAPVVASLLGGEVTYVGHLVLGAIAMVRAHSMHSKVGQAEGGP